MAREEILECKKKSETEKKKKDYINVIFFICIRLKY